MPVDEKQVVQEAQKLGKLVAQHPAIARYKDARESLAKDPDAARLMNEFTKQLQALSQQEEQGIPLSADQRRKISVLQTQIASHLTVKAYSIAEVEYYDLMRKVSQAIQQETVGKEPEPAGGEEASPKLKLSL